MEFFKAIQNLPEHEPRPDLWDRIDAELRTDAAIDRALDDLPVFEPKADAWEQIAENLETTPARPLWKPVIGWVAAASAVLVAGIWLIFQPVSNEKVTISYATETVETEWAGLPESGPSSADQNVETFLEEQCEQQTVVCQKPEVKELKKHLDELNTRKSTVEEKLAVFGNDPVLVQAQIKIENERAEVTKELVRILRI